ncbi:MAG: methionine biosynthesis protein MetW [Planctomycetota bacterium]|jgi:methionine biosynthesis protein MetW
MNQEYDKINKYLLQQISEELVNKLDPGLHNLGAGKLLEFIQFVGTSALRTTDKEGNPLIRWQDKVIEEEITDNSSVLDLGCGEGNLLKKLIADKNVIGQGIELEDESVFKCIEKGVPVIQGNIDKGLQEFRDNSFDYVILEETLQTLLHPVMVLEEMLRIGRRSIVSFPNFGYWRVRLDLGLRGRMPVTEWLPHHWYNTPNIHLLTLQDFVDWAENNKVNIIKGHVLSEGEIRDLRPADNLYADEILLIIEKEKNHD